MVEDSKQAGDQNQVPVEVDEFAARRKVIKGMASVAPVIMTLGSGEVLANSSNLQCLKEPPPMLEKCIDKDLEDDWYRKRKWVREVGENEYESCYKDSQDCVKKNCLVYVDTDGEQLSQRDGGSPITKSCYNSFLPTR